MDTETVWIPKQVWEEMIPRAYNGNVNPSPTYAAKDMVHGYLQLHAAAPRTGLALTKSRVAQLAQDASGRLLVYMMRESLLVGDGRLVGDHAVFHEPDMVDGGSFSRNDGEDIFRCTQELGQLYVHAQFPISTQKQTYVSLAQSAARHVGEIFDRYCDLPHKALLAKHINADIKALERYHRFFK